MTLDDHGTDRSTGHFVLDGGTDYGIDRLLASSETCAEMLAAFQEAGLAESHVGWLQGNFFGGDPGPASGDPCAGAEGPLEHDHFFTDAGAFLARTMRTGRKSITETMRLSMARP